jgi:hypothetical protein
MSAILDELKANIREAIQAVHHKMSQCMMDDFTKCLQVCITAEGDHLLHSVFKKYTVYVSNLISKNYGTC